MIPTLIVPTLSKYDLLAEMIASIDHPIGHAIVIDNGGSCPDLRSDMIGRISILRMPNNLGVAASWNLGIQLSPDSDRWLIVNDDITFISDGLRRLSEADPDALIQDWRMSPRWSCFLLPEQAVRTVGLFDDYYWPGMGEERNYAHRCASAEISMKHLPKWYEHQGGATRMEMRGWRSWTERHIRLSATTSIVGWNLNYRREMGAYLNGGPEIQATSDSLQPEITGVTR